jgi:hypothetical protein
MSHLMIQIINLGKHAAIIENENITYTRAKGEKKSLIECLFKAIKRIDDRQRLIGLLLLINNRLLTVHLLLFEND